MTHLVNIPHILKNGITHFNSDNANPDFKPIGDSSLISTRNDFLLDNGKKLGDYIPFYFGVRTPMLYVLQKGYNLLKPTSAENIVYCVTSVQKILEKNLDFIFTDGHAVDRFTTKFLKSDISNIDDLIDWTAVKSKYWNDENDLDLKRRKEAEFLVLGDIPLDSILGYIVYNQKAHTHLTGLGIDDEIIFIKSNYYF